MKKSYELLNGVTNQYDILLLNKVIYDDKYAKISYYKLCYEDELKRLLSNYMITSDKERNTILMDFFSYLSSPNNILIHKNIDFNIKTNFIKYLFVNKYKYTQSYYNINSKHCINKKLLTLKINFLFIRHKVFIIDKYYFLEKPEFLSKKYGERLISKYIKNERRRFGENYEDLLLYWISKHFSDLVLKLSKKANKRKITKKPAKVNIAFSNLDYINEHIISFLVFLVLFIIMAIVLYFTMFKNME